MNFFIFIGSSNLGWKPKTNSVVQQPNPQAYGFQVDPEERKREIMDKEKKKESLRFLLAAGSKIYG